MRKLLVIAALSVASAMPLAGCSTSPGVNASKDLQTDTVRGVVGNALVGAKGATPADQDKIDDTAAGLCGAHVWTQAECARHTQETAG